MSGRRPDWAPAALDALAGRLPADDAARRRELLDAFLAQGLPHAKREAWKYTDLGALADTDYRPAAMPEQSPDFERPALPDAHRVVFGNGLYAAHVSQHTELDGLQIGPANGSDATPSHPVALLNAALATGGCSIALEAGRQLNQPLHVYAWQEADAEAMSHLRHRMELGREARASLVLEQRPAGGLATQVLDLRLDEGAELNLYRVQAGSADCRLLTVIRASIAAGARLNLFGVDVGGQLVRTDVEISLDGEDARLELSGACALGGESRVDNQVTVTHAGPGATSRQVFRGVVADKAMAVLNSRVVVDPQAQRSDSEQSLCHLLLNPGAEVNAKPELEIYADDVKCAHGATVGALDEVAIHYLRTRGLDEPTARALMTRAFLREALAGIRHDGVRELADTALDARLPAVPGLDELA